MNPLLSPDDKPGSLIIVQERADRRQRDLWMHRVTGAAMEPTLRNGDFVGVLRVDGFRYDGLYVISAGWHQGEEHLDVCRCQSVGGGRIHIYHDHHVFQEGSHVTREEFERIVRGLVVMRCHVDDAKALGL